MTALDTNVLSALLTGDEANSAEAVALLRAEDQLVACPVVYAELAAHPKGDEAVLESLFSSLRIDIDWVLDKPIWKQARLRYREYAFRRRKNKAGVPKRLLADFIIGAHALSTGRLLSFDKHIYAAAFPELTIISSSHERSE